MAKMYFYKFDTKSGVLTTSVADAKETEKQYSLKGDLNTLYISRISKGSLPIIKNEFRKICIVIDEKLSLQEIKNLLAQRSFENIGRYRREIEKEQDMIDKIDRIADLIEENTDE